ncbi:MAG TPA: hypothetical protein VMH48_08420 [Methylomirabilota bacterium]|nr:hypothetical protein [Methylomirabilota bacterium]
MQLTQKIWRGVVLLLPVAFDAARNQVAVGIFPGLGARHYVVQATGAGGGSPAAIEAAPAFAGVNGQAKGTGSPEVQLLKIGAAGRRSAVGWGLFGVHGADLVRQANVDHMTDVAALDQAQSSDVHQAADSQAHAPACNAHILSEPDNRKAQTELAFQEAVAEEMRIDSAVEDREFETRGSKVFQLFPHFDTVEFLGVHCLVLIGN